MVNASMLRRFVLPVLLLVADGCVTSESTACDGFADRKMAITGAEYRACAGDILAALDALERPLRSMVAGSATDDERRAARQAYRRLRTLIGQTGIQADYLSTRPGTVIVKWTDESVSAFNSAAFTASVQYMAVLSHPNADNLAQGAQAHEDARRYYRSIH